VALQLADGRVIPARCRCPMCRQAEVGCEKRLFRNGGFYPMEGAGPCDKCGCGGTSPGKQSEHRDRVPHKPTLDFGEEQR